jgi:hypothetical protein
MDWMTIRLELARNPGFPKGTPSRAYLLRVPVTDEGFIDERALAREPGRATARRFWSTDPDQFGHIERLNGSWALRWNSPASKCWSLLESGHLRVDGFVEVREPDGTSNSFRVASMRSFGAPKSTP